MANKKTNVKDKNFSKIQPLGNVALLDQDDDEELIDLSSIVWIRDIFDSIKPMKIKEIIIFILLICVFTVMSISIMLAYLSRQSQERAYYFTPDFKINKTVYGDWIDSEAKLQAILEDSSINKENVPKLGDYIIHENGKLAVIHAQKMNKFFEVSLLQNIVSYDYSSNPYQFIPNMTSEFDSPLIVEKIKNKATIKLLLNSKSIILHQTENIELGSFIWRNRKGEYVILKGQDFLKIHLIDSTKNDTIKFFQ